MRLFALIISLVSILAACASNGGSAANNSGLQSQNSTHPLVQHWGILKTQHFYPDGFSSSTQTNEYDPSGRIQMEREYNGSDVLVIQRRHQYKPDNTVEILTLDADNVLQAKVLQEFQKGLLIRERLLSPSDEVHFTSNFRYDDQGRKIFWGISGKSAATTTSEYFYQANRLVRIIVTGPDQAVIKRYERVYDQTGLLNHEDEFNGKDILLRQVFYTWEGKLLVREETRGVPSGVISTIIYHYDDKARATKIEIFGQHGDLLEYQIQDWIELKTTGNGK